MRNLIRVERLDQFHRAKEEQFGFIPLEAAALEKFAEDGDVTDAGNLREVDLLAVVYQPGQRETLTVAQFERRFGAAHAQPRDEEIAQLHRRAEVEARNLRVEEELNVILVNDGRREFELDPELLELHRNATRAADAGDICHREFPAGNKAGRLAVHRDQVRFGQAAQRAALLQRPDEVLIVAAEEEGDG